MERVLHEMAESDDEGLIIIPANPRNLVMMPSLGSQDLVSMRMVPSGHGDDDVTEASSSSDDESERDVVEMPLTAPSEPPPEMRPQSTPKATPLRKTSPRSWKPRRLPMLLQNAEGPQKVNRGPSFTSATRWRPNQDACGNVIKDYPAPGTYPLPQAIGWQPNSLQRNARGGASWVAKGGTLSPRPRALSPVTASARRIHEVEEARQQWRNRRGKLTAHLPPPPPPRLLHLPHLELLHLLQLLHPLQQARQAHGAARDVANLGRTVRRPPDA